MDGEVWGGGGQSYEVATYIVDRKAYNCILRTSRLV